MNKVALISIIIILESSNIAFGQYKGQLRDYDYLSMTEELKNGRYSQVIDTNQKKAKNLYYADSQKIIEDELLSTLSISPRRDKIALVKTDSRLCDATDSSNAYLVTMYKLWFVDLNTRQAKVLLTSDDVDNDGIYAPSFSPDGNWIAFETFDPEGHSPLTTAKVWIINVSNYGVENIILPEPYNHFSSWHKGWTNNNELIVYGLKIEHVSGKWKDIDVEFIFNCYSKTIKPIN